MSIKVKVSVLVVGLAAAIIISNVLLLWVEKNALLSDTEEVTTELEKRSNEQVKREMMDLTTTISEEIVLLEREVDLAMLNAAYTVRERDQRTALDNQQLASLAKEVGMTDLYLTNPDGVFTYSTEDAAIGLSLYEIWDGYKMLMNGQADVLPSTLKIKEETGEIFKFTAIPRADGKGIIESALEAGKFEEAMEKYINGGAGVQGLYLIDNTSLVLTENVKLENASSFKKGEIIESAEVQSVFEKKEPIVELTKEMAEIYAPVIENDAVKYVMYLTIDPKPYFAQSQIAKDAFVKIGGVIDTAIWKIIISNLIISVILLGLIILVLNQILKPLKTFAARLHRLHTHEKNAGPTIRVKEKELEEIQQAVDEVVEDYKVILDSVYGSTIAVKGAQQQYEKEMAVTVETLRDLSKAVNDSAENHQHQAERVRDAEDIVTTMASTLKDVSGQTNDLQQLSNKSSHIAEESIAEIERVAQGIENMSEEVEENVKRVNDLLVRSTQISGIIELIQGIAEQTNLLSLNASIEAARAGEQGKGFAVVANEVRNLAEESGRATDEISSILHDLKAEIEASKGSNDHQLEVIKMSRKEMDQAKQVFEQLIKVTKQSSHEITTLNQAVNQLFVYGNQENEVFAELNEKIEANAANSEELLSMVEEVNASLEQLQHLLDKLSTSTTTLEQLF
ncbi:methyl-accepting chemotaxis protein [Bacillus tianshenii]|nr:methyl-accepting chemotaxis protein [Bacillus tianshenii]